MAVNTWFAANHDRVQQASITRAYEMDTLGKYGMTKAEKRTLKAHMKRAQSHLAKERK